MDRRQANRDEGGEGGGGKVEYRVIEVDRVERMVRCSAPCTASTKTIVSIDDAVGGMVVVDDSAFKNPVGGLPNAGKYSEVFTA